MLKTEDIRFKENVLTTETKYNHKIIFLRQKTHKTRQMELQSKLENISTRKLKCPCFQMTEGVIILSFPFPEK